MSPAAAQASSASVTGRPSGTGTPTAFNNDPRQFLVLGDGLGNGAGAVGLGGLDAAEFLAVAELHHAVGVQPPEGNAAGLGRATIAPVLGPRQTSWAKSRSRSTSAFTSKGRSWIAARMSSRAACRHSDHQLLVVVLDDHAINARLRGLAGPPESDLAAGKRLQFQRNVLENMSRDRFRRAAFERTRRARRCCSGARSCVGSQLISRSLNPGKSVEGRSRSFRSTQTSITGALVQMFGPRKASTLRNSIVDSHRREMKTSPLEKRRSLRKIPSLTPSEA